ncbi:hypothetical protein B0T25DRAFT_536840 [Lasiosphaeria hispida]|uniref:Methyltransferase type 11 domain-containing protein n=1 Tax=Lasiosphaeria hispida TaxID=260671 RepID=A0AAJ0HKU9_9PEZI|nr:hypothetical protein B0T25DRAFT_536840 [Lasiosphaeria hispida]
MTTAQENLPPDASPGLPFPKYFSALTMPSRQEIARAIFLQKPAFDGITDLVPITLESKIHDNAAGPRTATSVLVCNSLIKMFTGLEVDQAINSTDPFSAEALPSILVTDNVPAIVMDRRESFISLPSITVKETDEIPSNHFTHSILNFSIFPIADPLRRLQEIKRTVRGAGGGVVAVLTWRRFGASEVIHAAQQIVRPNLPPMRLPHPEFLQEGVLEGLVTEVQKRKSPEKECCDGARLGWD